MIYLKQSTASQEFLIGPFVDSTDGNTAKTALTIANTDVKIWVSGATTLANKNSGGGTHISNGNYYVVLDATDTATLGSGAIVVQMTGALAVRHDFCILAANIYDSIVGGGDLLQVDVEQYGNSNGTFASGIPSVNASQIAGDATGATNLKTSFNDTAGSVPWMGIIDQGTAQAATSTTLQLRAAASFADLEPYGCFIVITGGTTGVGQVRKINNYVGATDTATVDAWQTTPTGTITYKVLANAPMSTAEIASLFSTQIDGTTTFSQSLRLHNAVLGGKASGLGTATATFRDLADTKDRVNASVDANGNRTSVTTILT